MRMGILGILILSLCGCSIIDSENNVYGHYELTSRAAKIHLDVNADHSYSEILEFTNGPEQRKLGQWRWMEDRVCFDMFLVPTEFRSGLYGNDSHYQPKTIGRAYQVDDCLPAEIEYGTTIIEINPDSPENFKMVNRPPGRP